MDGIGEISPKGATFGEDELKYLIPFARTGHHNMSPSRQKVIKTKPRGFDEETVATFGKVIHADVQMDDGIWALLPEDLLIEVLARMPPFFIFKMRSVCRRWNSILYDSSFLKSHSSVPSHGPCLLASWKSSQSHQCLVFSLPLKTWYKIPFNFLPDWAFWLVGSSGGLVCFSGFDGLTFKALVCNPLTQMWRVLPSMNYNQQRQLIMVVDRADHSFKVIAAGDIYGDKTLPTEVYDSKTNIWSLHQIMPAVNLCSSKMALCDSRLYLETLSPPGMMMYRMDKGQWEHIPAKFPRPLLDGYLVAGAHRRLYLVGRIGLFSTRQSMRIWELDHAKTIWVEISRMPPKHLRALLRLSAERFECFGQDNLICFTSWNQGKGLLYDVDKKAWSWIAGCALHLCNSQVELAGFMTWSRKSGVAMTHNDRVVECVKELGNESKMVAVTKSGRLKGRKMGVNDAPKKEDRNDEMINTGKDMNSPSKVYETPISEDSSVLSNTKTIGTQKLVEATAEIFKMMNKDYHQKARRRPPINNNLPVNDKNEDVAP